MHTGPLGSIQSWNDGAALDPGSDVLPKRIQRLAGKARQHLSDKPLAVRDHHRHGRTGLTTHAIVAQGTVGPAAAAVEQVAASQQLPEQLPTVIDSEQPASISAMAATQATLHPLEFSSLPTDTLPQQPLTSSFAAIDQQPQCTGLELGISSQQTSAGMLAATSAQPPSTGLALAAPSQAPPSILQHSSASENPLQIPVRCKTLTGILTAIPYNAAYESNFANPKWQPGKKGKESGCQCIETTDAAGVKQLLTAGAFEKAAGCTNEKAKLASLSCCTAAVFH